MTTDYLSCLAVNRTFPKEADDEALPGDRGQAVLPNDPTAKQEKTEQQRENERVVIQWKRKRALDSLWGLEFNEFPAAVKRVLVHAAVPIGWLFKIGGCHIPPPCATTRRSNSNASTTPRERSGSGGDDEENSEGKPMKRSRKGTFNKSTLKQLLEDSRTCTEESSEKAPEVPRSRKGSKKPEPLCRLDLHGADLLWLPAGREFWRSVAAVMEVDVTRNLLEFIPSVCASPVLPFLKIMYVQENPLGLMLEDLVGTLTTNGGDTAPTAKRTWAAIVKQLSHASKRADSWDVQKLLLVGPCCTMRSVPSCCSLLYI